MIKSNLSNSFNFPQFELATTPEAVSAAITSPRGLGTWLCDYARIENRRDGRLYMQWHDGRQALGRWIDFRPPQHLAWQWQFEGEANATTVSFILEPHQDGTALRLELEGLPEVMAEETIVGWREALQALKEYVEAGLDARTLRRPLLGINYTLLSPDVAKAKGLERVEGVLVDEVAERGAASAAGLVARDVMVMMGGFPLTDWHSLVGCLHHFRAGDTVEVEFWRGDQLLKTMLTFGGRQPPDVPTDGESIATFVRQSTDRLVLSLYNLLDGINEAEARFVPTEGEWTIKKQIIDLSLTLRGDHENMARVAVGEPMLEPTDEAFELRQTILTELPVQELASRLLADLRESEAEVLHILSTMPGISVQRWLAESVLRTANHFDEHIERIGNVLEQARSAAGWTK